MEHTGIKFQGNHFHSAEHCKVALLAGGRSSEREVSLSSGLSVQKALQEFGYDVLFLDPANTDDLRTLVEDPFDVAFICLHGEMGEDGKIQGLLEVLNIPYTGSGIWASALAINKICTKEYYQKHGLRTPDFCVATPQESFDSSDFESRFNGKCVVKPATEGSTVGISVVSEQSQFEQAFEVAFQKSATLLVEEFISGVEYTVAVIGNDQAEALPVIQIIPASGFYDYESKYSPGGSRHICPAPLSDDETREIQEMALTAHLILGCRGVSRSDFIQSEDGKFWILETNTIPGMTETSLLPDAARAAGIEFPELCSMLIDYAFEEHRKQ